MDNFIYDVPTKVYFGKGQENQVGKIIKEYQGHKVLLHYGGHSAIDSGLIDRVKLSLKDEKIPFVKLGGVKANPELGLVRQGIKLCQEEGVDFVLAVGGGSVLDSAKDIANGVANPDVDVWDFSIGKETPKATLKKGCILTLAAAGSEMSNSCVISDEEKQIKRGYNSSFNRMDFAIEDPELTYSVPPFQTACGACDIALHTLERFFMPGAETDLSDALAIAVVKTVMKAGKDCLKNPRDYEARANMMWASSLAHNDLTGLGRKFQLTVHQLEHEVSGMYPNIAHGAGLAALWPSWARYVYKANIGRWLQFAHEIWNVDINYEQPEKTILKAIDLQENYYREIGLPTSLSELDVKKEDLLILALHTSRNMTRVLAGYKPLKFEDILAIFNMAYPKR